MTTSAFASLPLAAPLLTTLSELGFAQMTPVQAQSLPHALQGKDVIAQAKTGSGKTVAFGLGILQGLDVKRFAVQSLVLCPTRELADQVASEIRRLGRGIHNIKVLTLCGGQPIGPQIGSLEHGAHIIVGTPGRVLDHATKGRLSLNALTMLVLDEADRMLDMGFQADLDAIIEHLPGDRQTLLFSATYPEQIQKIADRVLRNPIRVTVEEQHSRQSIEQTFYRCNNDEQRLQTTQNLLLIHRPESAMIFATTKQSVQEIGDSLRSQGFSAVCLHGDMEQRDRDQTLVQFANKSVNVLVATDVAARGLDISAVDMVINFHLARDEEVHVHRVGRTGRAGQKGVAYSLFGDKDDFRLRCLEDLIGQPLTLESPPSDVPAGAKPAQASMITLLIDGGKKTKLRPGDIVGALTSTGEIKADQVGNIKITPMKSYVAVERTIGKRALALITDKKMKGRQFRARILRS